MRSWFGKMRQQKLKGFTLIESLVLLFIFAITALAFSETYTVGTRMIIESKNRLGATALANQKMEIIRSIDYATIGTTTGIPAGDIPEYETISVNTVNYQVHTFVQYADDVFDGQLGSTPTDAIPNDYKRVRVAVSWGAGGDDQTVSIFANISPEGVETSSGGGVLSINILSIVDGGAVALAGATVHIVNSSAGINITTATDATGNITLPGTPAGQQNYALTISKSGYYGTQTYPPYPTSNYNPVDEHASVVAGVVNPKTMWMNQYADITIRSQDPFTSAVPDISFHMTGGKKLGTDPDTSASVYEYDQILSTNASGIKDIPDQSDGQYTLSESDARYQFYKLNPSGITYDVFDAPAGQTTTVDMILLDTQIGSLKVIVTNAGDGSPVAGATAHLTSSALGYYATTVTDQYGFAYFPQTLPELVVGTYDLTVSAAGFADNNSTVDVNGGLITKAVNLNP